MKIKKYGCYRDLPQWGKYAALVDSNTGIESHNSFPNGARQIKLWIWSSNRPWKEAARTKKMGVVASPSSYT